MNGHVPRLHLVGPLDLPPWRYPAVAQAAVAGGVEAVHVRLPGAPEDTLLALAQAVRAAVPQAVVIVNGSLAVARQAGADGVQLPERAAAMRVERDARLRYVGRSVHDIDAARAAADADWLLAGHVFDTPSHPGAPGRGLPWLAELCAAVTAPVIAIGGIDTGRIPAVLATGAWGIALGRELLHAADPAAVATAARHAIEMERST